jgi:hypothetical protein
MECEIRIDFTIWSGSFCLLVKGYEDFKRNVSVRDYEQIREYIEKIINGGSDILWPGKPVFMKPVTWILLTEK